jgi:hypothetical protein
VWTLTFVFGPVGLFLHPGLVNEFLAPLLLAPRAPGMER